jgi:hypothetical protein
MVWCRKFIFAVEKKNRWNFSGPEFFNIYCLEVVSRSWRLYCKVITKSSEKSCKERGRGVHFAVVQFESSEYVFLGEEIVFLNCIVGLWYRPVTLLGFGGSSIHFSSSAAPNMLANADYKDLVASLCAGTIAGASGVFVGHPFDTLKVRIASRCTAFILVTSFPIAD